MITFFTGISSSSLSFSLAFQCVFTHILKPPPLVTEWFSKEAGGGRYLDPPTEDSSFSCHSQPEMSVGPEQILVLSNIISGLVLHPEMFFKR